MKIKSFQVIRYALFIFLCVSNTLFFQNCSKWNGSVQMDTKVSKLGFKEQIIPMDNPNINAGSSRLDSVCLPNETSSLACTNDPKLFNRLICKDNKFVDENGFDDCFSPNLSPIIKAISLTSPSPELVKIEVSVEDAESSASELTLFYMGKKFMNGEIFAAPPGEFIIHVGEITVQDPKNNSTANSDEYRVMVEALPPPPVANHSPIIKEVNGSAGNCSLTLTAIAEDSDGDALRFFLDGKEFINGSKIQTQATQDIQIANNLSVSDLDANGNIKSTTKYEGSFKQNIVCDQQPPEVKAQIVAGKTCGTIMVSVEAKDESSVTYSMNNGPFQSSNIFEISLMSDQLQFSLSKTNFIAVKDSLGQQTILASSAPVEAKACVVPPPPNPCDGFVSETNLETACPANYMNLLGKVSKTSSCTNNNGTKKIDWNSDYSACGPINQCLTAVPKVESCGAGFINQNQVIPVNCVPDQSGNANFVRNESSCIALSCDGSANDPNKPANVICGSQYENSNSVAATFSCLSQNQDGSYNYSQPQSTGETCKPLFCSTQPAFDMSVFSKNCLNQGANYVVTGSYKCDENLNSVTLPLCEQKCSSDKVYANGSCSCASGQILDSKGVCYTPAANLCANSNNLVTTMQTVTFGQSPKKTCDWSINQNYSRLDQNLRARKEEKQTLALPQGATLCSMDFAFTKNTLMHYDDHIIMTYNDIVFSTTEGDLVKKLVNRGTASAPLYEYNWAKLSGTGNNPALAASTLPMCLDARGTKKCQWPDTDTTGTIEITVDPAEIQKISDLSLGRTDRSFGLITTGDNDDSDCQHTAISFNVRVTYAPQQ